MLVQYGFAEFTKIKDEQEVLRQNQNNVLTSVLDFRAASKQK